MTQTSGVDPRGGVPPPLSAPEAIAYWDNRHRAHSDLRSGGHIGLDDAANEFFYLVRLGKLLELVGDLNGLSEPRFVLDAGCGKGRFAAALAACGMCVDGIDTSEAAIEASRARGGARYMVSSLSRWRSPLPYDVVFSIDVLFHVVDDDDWAASVVNLASLTRLGGKLILTDDYREDRRQAGDYIVHRPWREYLDLLAPRGFTGPSFTPYGFRDNPVGFLVFKRTR